MVNYSDGKMYRLVNDIDDAEYIGSTTQPSCKRLVGHRGDAIQHPDRKIYKHLNEVGWENI
jgi:hypothetical protein